MNKKIKNFDGYCIVVKLQVKRKNGQCIICLGVRTYVVVNCFIRESLERSIELRIPN